MTDEQKKSIETLENYGFSHDTARMMIRMGELADPSTDNVRRNVEILTQYISLNAITSDQCWKAVLFLKRDCHTNEQMTAVPARYAFTEEQTHDYNEKILDWEISSDLKAELDDALKLVMPDEAERVSVYREMYCNGVWSDCQTICDICRELYTISDGYTGLVEIVRKWWRILFAYYSAALQYIRLLKGMFASEHVWKIFCDAPANSYEFSEHFNPFDRKDEVIEELKRKYADYLIDQ